MPDLSQHFQSPYLNAVTFALRCRDLQRDPYRQGVALSVSSVVCEALPSRKRGGRKEEKWVMYFREWDKGLPMSRPHFNIIAPMYGPDCDEWVGARLRFILVEGEGGQGGDAIRVVPEKLPGVHDKIGAKVAEKFAQRAQRAGAKLDDFAEWAKKHDEALYADLVGLQPEAWTYLIAIEAGKWLDRIEHPEKYAHERRSPVPSKPGDPKRGAQQDLALEDEDIPF